MLPSVGRHWRRRRRRRRRQLRQVRLTPSPPSRPATVHKHSADANLNRPLPPSPARGGGRAGAGAASGSGGGGRCDTAGASSTAGGYEGGHGCCSDGIWARPSLPQSSPDQYTITSTVRATGRQLCQWTAATATATNITPRYGYYDGTLSSNERSYRPTMNTAILFCSSLCAALCVHLAPFGSVWHTAGLCAERQPSEEQQTAVTDSGAVFQPGRCR